MDLVVGNRHGKRKAGYSSYVKTADKMVAKVARRNKTARRQKPKPKLKVDSCVGITIPTAESGGGLKRLPAVITAIVGDSAVLWCKAGFLKQKYE